MRHGRGAVPSSGRTGPVRPTVAMVHEATLAVQADVRRLGAVIVRTETQAKTVAERVNTMGAETLDALERLRRQHAEATAAAGRAAEERARLLLPFLDLADNFARALRAAAQPGGLEPGPVDGTEAAEPSVERREALEVLTHLADHLDRILRAAGLRAVAGTGMPFDPRLHRAVGTVERPESDGRVVLVDRQGYRLDGMLLRPAEVWVGAGRGPGYEVAAEGGDRVEVEDAGRPPSTGASLDGETAE